MAVGGYLDAPRAVRLLRDGKPLKFEHQRNRVVLKDLPKTCPDPHAGVTVIAMEFDRVPRYAFGSAYPQLHSGVRHVYFGHIHRRVSGYRYRGLTFHNGGAPMRGQHFRILEATVPL